MALAGGSAIWPTSAGYGSVMAMLDQAGLEAARVRSNHRDTLEATYAGAHDGDEKAVYHMRVASRRLRSSLRTFCGLWDRPPVDATFTRRWARTGGPCFDRQYPSIGLLPSLLHVACRGRDLRKTS